MKLLLAALWVIAWWSLPVLAAHLGGPFVNLIGALGTVAFGASIIALLYVFGPDKEWS